MITTPPELLTGLTDLFGGVLTMLFFLWLCRLRTPEAKPWQLLMCLLTASNLIGGIVHVFVFPDIVDDIVWFFLTFLLCATVAVFGVCAVREDRPDLTKRATVIFGVFCVVSYTVMMVASIWYEDFLKIFVAYAAVCLLYAMGRFTVTAIRQKKPHLFWYVAGLAVQIPGGVVQAQRTLYFTLLWQMDFNTVYHLILVITVILLFIGYRRGLRRKEN